MSLFSSYDIILESKYSTENVLIILERKMELERDDSYLIERSKATQSKFDNFALLECWVEEKENKTLITIGFRTNPMLLITYIFTFIFALIGILEAITQYDVFGLIFVIPLAIEYPMSRIIFAFNKRNKMLEIERLLHASFYGYDK